MVAAAAISLGPALWTLSTSFKSQREVQSFPPTVWPHDLRLDNYVGLFSSHEFRGALVTSVVVTVVVTVLVLAFAFPCAYGLVRFRAFGSRLMLLLIALAQTVPAIVFLIPVYSIATGMGLYDTKAILVIVYTGLLIPFSTLILVAFIRTIPVEMEEAASVDGCGPVTIMFRVVLPVARPGLATVAVFTGLYSWNEFLVAVVLGGEKALPITVLISHFITQKSIQWGPMTAAVMVVLLPVLLAVVLLQRQLVSGLAAGALKG
jgi:ABC-type glycerol-3-phosphate transport system permease component